MDENRAKILQGLVCETPNCCETLFDSCDLCKQGLCEVCYQGYHLCINDEDFGDVNSDGNLVDDSNCFDDDNQSPTSGRRPGRSALVDQQLSTSGRPKPTSFGRIWSAGRSTFFEFLKWSVEEIFQPGHQPYIILNFF